MAKSEEHLSVMENSLGGILSLCKFCWEFGLQFALLGTHCLYPSALSSFVLWGKLLSQANTVVGIWACANPPCHAFFYFMMKNLSPGRCWKLEIVQIFLIILIQLCASTRALVLKKWGIKNLVLHFLFHILL